MFTQRLVNAIIETAFEHEKCLKCIPEESYAALENVKVFWKDLRKKIRLEYDVDNIIENLKNHSLRSIYDLIQSTFILKNEIKTLFE